MSFQFANTRAALFGQRHLFFDPTKSDIIGFVKGANTHRTTCVLCGGTADANCASLSAQRCQRNGVWRVTPSTLRRVSVELQMLNAIRYQRRLALVLDVPAISVKVEFLTDATMGPCTKVAWKGGKLPIFHSSVRFRPAPLTGS